MIDGMMILSALVGYLLGSVNSAILVGKLWGVDVRKHGSGNAGTTNTLRVLGKKPALLVLLGDVLKGILAYLAGRFIAGDLGAMTGGIAAIVGHNWPLYFGFKGGKGALTSITVVFMMDPFIGLIILLTFIVLVALTRYVSLGSVVGGLLFPILALLVFQKSTEFILFALFLCLMVVVRHRSNIERLFKGTESKLGKKKTEQQ